MIPLISEVKVKMTGKDPVDKVSPTRSIHYIVRRGDRDFTLGEAYQCSVEIGGKPVENIVHIDVPDILNVLRAIKNSRVYDLVEHTPVPVMRHLHKHHAMGAVDTTEKLEHLAGVLRPFQKTLVNRAVHMKRFYIGDEMGTGKTLQALATAFCFKEQWPVLIISPTILKFNWKAEILMWYNYLEDEGSGTHNIDESDIQIIKTSNDVINDKRWANRNPHKFLIMSYGILNNAKVRERLGTSYKIVIADECHYIKSISSLRTQSANEMLQRAEVRLLLSGTPFNFPSEAYPQIRALYPEIYEHFFNEENPQEPGFWYAWRYCKPSQVKARKTWEWEFRGYDRHEELHAVLSTFMGRRRKKDVLKQLPPKNRITITLEPLKDKQLEELKELQEKEQSDEKTVAGKLNFMASFRLSCEFKIPNVVKFVNDHLIDNVMVNDPSERIIIFFHHSEMRLTLEELMIKRKMTYKVIYGDTPDSERATFQDEFNNGDYQFAILSIMACAAGLTLTRSKTIVFSEIMFGFNLHGQAEDRAHRMGQKHDVVDLFYLMQPGTSDYVNMNIIKRKERESSKIIDGEESHIYTKNLKPGESEDGLFSMMKELNASRRAYKYGNKKPRPKQDFVIEM